MLACAEPGATNIDVAAQLGLSRLTVALWRRRFAERGVDGLLDEPRPGAPRTITDAQIERAVVTTLEGEPPNATHWSTRSLAEAVGLSQSAVVRIWHAFALQPHRSETFKLSRDPLFVDKVRDIVGLSAWLAKRPRYHLHFTPTSASWINMVEGWFALLTRRQFQRGAFRSTADLEAAIHRYIETNNANPHPFTWTKSADAILDSIKRCCQRHTPMEP